MENKTLSQLAQDSKTYYKPIQTKEEFEDAMKILEEIYKNQDKRNTTIIFYTTLDENGEVIDPFGFLNHKK